jgi:hypothetical protein
MGSDKKSEALGMSYGKAANILRKNIIFHLMQKCREDKCFRCGKPISNIEDMSIEHKISWMKSNNPIDNFFSMDNIAFSHLNCNISANKDYTNSRLGLKGVTHVPNRESQKKYRANVYNPQTSKNVHVGYFATAEEAAEAYDKKALEILGDKAITNKGLGLI